MGAIRVIDRFVDLSDVNASGLAGGCVSIYDAGTGKWVVSVPTPSNISGFNAAASAAAPVQSVAGRTGAVTIAQADVAGLTTADSPTFAGLFSASLTGSTASGGSLTLLSTQHATKGFIYLGTGAAYDGVNVRFGIGLQNPAFPLDVLTSGTTPLQLKTSNTYSILQMGNSAAATVLQLYAVGSEAVLSNQRNAGLTFQTNGTDRMRVESTGVVGINKPSSIGAQLHVVAGAAGTKGIRVGMAASPSATSYPLSIADSTDATLTYFDTNGNLIKASGDLGISSNNGRIQFGSVSNLFFGNSFYGSSYLHKWTNVAGDPGQTVDLSIGRNAAGILQIGDGGANANGTLKAASVVLSRAGGNEFLQLKPSSAGYSAVALYDSAGTRQGLFGYNESSNRAFFQVENANHVFDILTNSVERLRIDDAGRVGIGTGTSNITAAALLELSSTTKGLLPPRMTTVQRDAISTPPEGLVIYNTTSHTIDFYNGTAWKQIAGV